jgi:ribosomal protein S18 acetylase RimI-like enzyme
MIADAAGRHVGRFRDFDNTLAAHHPDTGPHHHLTMVAVAAGHQGRGVGSTLLHAHHRRLTPRGLPAYLEAADPASRRLYLRHGYHDLQLARFHLPGNGPPLWPMWREA